MDPNETLGELRKLTEFILEDSEEPFKDLTEEAENMATLFDALDGWLRSGGFIPTAWKGGKVLASILDEQKTCRRCGAGGSLS